MGQITTGLRSVLSSPSIYNLFQNMMGARGVRSEFARESIRARSLDRVLDIGCGTADILEFLPNIQYYGFDISEPYIAKARSRFGDRGTFECRILSASDVAALPKFDLVISIGVLHHLDDEVAKSALQTAFSALRPDGRLITLDPCFAKDQNPVARFLVSQDRGQNVRDLVGYKNLAHSIFAKVQAEIRHRAWLPYTHCILECTR
jgi:SAM-dependent methyltransferase